MHIHSYTHETLVDHVFEENASGYQSPSHFRTWATTCPDVPVYIYIYIYIYKLLYSMYVSSSLIQPVDCQIKAVDLPTVLKFKGTRFASPR